jgi:hypothetical protein
MSDAPAMSRAALAAKLHTLADAVAAGDVPLPAMRHDQVDGHRLRIVPRTVHNLLCAWRVATPQETDPVVLGCAGCGLCYLPESVDPAGTGNVAGGGSHE